MLWVKPSINEMPLEQLGQKISAIKKALLYTIGTYNNKEYKKGEIIISNYPIYQLCVTAVVQVHDLLPYHSLHPTH